MKASIIIAVIFFIFVIIVLILRQNTSPIPAEMTSIVPVQTTAINTHNKEGADAKPFWENTAMVQVCKKPYYSSQDCTDMSAMLLTDNSVLIDIPSQKDVVSRELTCFNNKVGGSGQKYVFCRSWDSNGQQWDLFPTWYRF